jgi:hypothetical protein
VAAKDFTHIPTSTDQDLLTHLCSALFAFLSKDIFEISPENDKCFV